MMRNLFLLFLLLFSYSAAALERLQVLGLFTGKAMVLIGDKRYLLAAGKSTPEGVKLLAADSNGAVLEIDGERRRLALGSQISSYYPAAKRKVVDIYPDRGGMYLVDGAVNGKAVDFLVDTGASAVAMSGRQAKMLDIDYRRRGIAGFAETASARVPAYYVKLDKVSVGTIRLYDVEAMVIEGDKPGAVLLGQSFLNHLQMRREGALLRIEQSY